MKRLTHLSLFSGIGGLDIAAEMAGIETVGQCEYADYPYAILQQHWPTVPKWRDIHTLTGDDFYRRTGLRTVDIISGGFPCQPFSQAGKRKGKEDDRYLWPEMLRVIRELRPTWVVGENVPGIVNLALDTVLSDLETEDYEVQTFVIPACGVDAPHRRDRVAILAHALNGSGTLWRDRKFQNTASDAGQGTDHRRGATATQPGERRQNKSGLAGVADGIRTAVHEADSDTDPDRLQGRHIDKVVDASSFTDCSSREREREREREPRVRRSTEIISGSHSAWNNWPDEPGIPRVADGIPNRVDRIKCLGNAVVPQQFYPFFAAIAEIERRQS